MSKATKRLHAAHLNGESGLKQAQLLTNKKHETKKI
jgi:hypothetical protein